MLSVRVAAAQTPEIRENLDEAIAPAGHVTTQLPLGAPGLLVFDIPFDGQLDRSCPDERVIEDLSQTSPVVLS